MSTIRKMVAGANGEPRLFVWAARVAVLLGAWALASAFLTSTTIFVVRLAAKPMLEDFARAQALRDSAMVAQLGGQIYKVADRQNLMAEGLKYPYGSEERNYWLKQMQLEPVPQPKIPAQLLREATK